MTGRSARGAPRAATVRSRPERSGSVDGLLDRIGDALDGGPRGPALRAAKVVRAMRKGAGLSQKQLAERVGFSQARMSEIELGKGTQGPSWAVMERIASACGQAIGVLGNTSPAVAEEEVEMDLEFHEALLGIDETERYGRPAAIRDLGVHLLPEDTDVTMYAGGKILTVPVRTVQVQHPGNRYATVLIEPDQSAPKGRRRGGTRAAHSFDRERE
jgi:transcriptional regulator with XRE-family HTH domain